MPEKSSWRRTACFILTLGIGVLVLVHSAPRAETVKDSDSAKALLSDVLEYIKTSITSADEDLTLKLEAEPSAKVRGNITKLIFPTPSILDKNGAGHGTPCRTASRPGQVREPQAELRLSGSRT